MNSLKEQLENITDLTSSSKEELNQTADRLIQESGAKITLEELNADNIKLSIKNINGKRAPKYELIDYTYNIFRSTIPEKYRITIVV